MDLLTPQSHTRIDGAAVGGHDAGGRRSERPSDVTSPTPTEARSIARFAPHGAAAPAKGPTP